MTTYPDLSPYEYVAHDRTRTTLNVGWLGGRSTFDTGEVDPGFRHALLELIVRAEVNVMRGCHSCELCLSESPMTVPFEAAHRGRVFLGNSEVHFAGPDGIAYAAPTMIVHYLDAHGYRPPRQFVDAVLHAAGRTEDPEATECACAAEQRRPF